MKASPVGGQHFLLYSTDLNEDYFSCFILKRTGRIVPVRVISPVQAESDLILLPDIKENKARVNAQPAEGPSFAIAPAGK